jgi:aminomethyltransferase
MNKTPFNEFHKRGGGRLIDFGGWQMPVQFAGILVEHRAVRERAGLFDISHMGQVSVTGPRAAEVLQAVTTNDVARLAPGRGQYSLLCRETGGVVDDLYVYELGPEKFFLIVNASRRGADLPWLKGRLPGGAEIVEHSEAAGLALQGPDSGKIALEFFPGADGLEKNRILECSWQGAKILAARTGYTGEDGFEIFGDAAALKSLYPRLQAAGAVPCGLGARDTLRLEMGYRLYGNDLDEGHSALEAGLGWVVKFDKGEFVGRAALLGEKERGPARRMIGFKLEEKGVPRHGHEVLFGGKTVGIVTSGTFSPSLQVGLGLAYVDNALVPKDAREGLAIRIHDRIVRAAIQAPPFYKKPAQILTSPVPERGHTRSHP